MRRTTFLTLAMLSSVLVASGAYAQSYPLTTLATLNVNGDVGNPAPCTIFISGERLYDASQDTLFSLPITGGTSTILKTFATFPTALTISGNVIYGAQGSAVFSLPVTGGNATTLATVGSLITVMTPMALSGGTLFGTTNDGGAYGAGSVFSVPVSGGTPTTLASFPQQQVQEQSGVIISGDTLYGTTQFGGANGQGSVYSLPIAGGAPNTLASFSGIAGNSLCGVTISGNTIYAEAQLSGSALQTSLFAVPLAGGVPTTLATVSGGVPEGGATIVVSGGNVCGITTNTVFSVPIAGGTATTLATFNPVNGHVPYLFGGLAVDPAGNLYCATETAIDSSNSTQVTVFKLQPVQPLTWAPAQNGNWDTSTPNWATASGTATYADGNQVIFNDVNPLTGLNVSNTSVTISSSVSPQSITFNNSGSTNGGVDYTIGGGPIAGTASIAKNGAGTVTLTSSNADSGGTTINGGVLNANAAGALGTGPVTVNGGVLNADAVQALGTGALTVNGGVVNINFAQSASSATLNAAQLNLNNAGALGAARLTITSGTLDNTSGNAVTLTNGGQTWNGNLTYRGSGPLDTGTGSVVLGTSSIVALNVSANTLTVSAVVSGTGAGLSLSGGGMLVLTASNRYSGATTINQGELVVNGSLVSPVTVNNGGILGGTGTLSRAIVSSGGTLAPGNPLGPLNLSSSLSLLSHSVLDYDLDTPLDSSEVLMPTGQLILSGQQFSDFNFTPLPGFAPGNYDLITFGSSSGSLGAIRNGTIDGFQANIAVQGDELVLNVVPEPATLALVVACIACILMCLFRHSVQRAARLVAALVLGSALAIHGSNATAQTFTNLLSFSGSSGAYPGAGPAGDLTLSGTTLFGMTSRGGNVGAGTVFCVGVNGNGFQNLLSFTGTGGAYIGSVPNAALTLSGTTLFGTTQSGGSKGYGNLFSVGTNGSGYDNLLSFTGIGNDPRGTPVLSGTNLYGTTTNGANGTLFSVGTNGSSFNTSFRFNSVPGAGANPTGNLVLSGTTLYGMTNLQGANGLGTVFSIGLNGTSFQTLLSFTGTSGAYVGSEPLGSLTLVGSTLYGMTFEGGSNGLGNVFCVGTDGTGYRNLLSFTGTGGAFPGANPWNGLTLVGTNLYGMTPNGGSAGMGNVFSIAINGSGFQNLLSFTNVGEYPGARPYGDFTPGPSATVALGPIANGAIITGGTLDFRAAVSNSATNSTTTLYGMTYSGASSGDGTVFALNVPGTNDLNFTLATSITGGTASLGAVTSASGSLAAGSSQSCTVSATSTALGVNTLSFTASDPNSTNLSQTATATLTVLDHAAAAFVGGGGTLNLNFGTLEEGSGTKDLQFQIENLLATYRAGLALNSITTRDPGGVFSTDATLFSDLAPGTESGLFDLFLNTSQEGQFSGQYQFNLSDEQDLSGWAGQQTLTLNVTADVVPEPGTLALLVAGTIGLLICAWRRSHDCSRWRQFKFTFGRRHIVLNKTMMRCFMLVLTMLGGVGRVNADTIVDTSPNYDGYYDVLGPDVDTISWSQTAAYNGVTISVMVYGPNDTIDAYLTSTLGPGAAAPLAMSTFTPAPSSGTSEVVFSGLTLSPGTYSLTLYDPTGQATRWAEGTAATTGIGDLFVGWRYAHYAEVDAAAPWQSQFNMLAPNDYAVATVTGTAIVPEPTPAALLLASGLCLLCFAWRRHRLRLAAILAVVLLPAALAQADVFHMPSGETSLQFVTVGDPGNVADSAYHSGMGTSTTPGTGLGAVGYTYYMGEYDVTLGQYVQFLNAVAKSDTYGLYNSLMGTCFGTQGISQSGNFGNYSYSVTGSAPGAANMPAFCVTWGDAARFCNWLQNGQPTGAEGNGTTETGAYLLSGATTDAALLAVASPAHSGDGAAQYFLPTEDEWYKAAFYVGGGTNAGYWSYPTKSDTTPINTLPDPGNHANFIDYLHTGTGGYTDPTYYLTPVGAFNLSPGPYGTFDTGGDVWQWDEAVRFGSFRQLRGGSYDDAYGQLSASDPHPFATTPTAEDAYVGFRVASSVPVPEPGSAALLLAGGLGLLALAWRRQKEIA